MHLMHSTTPLYLRMVCYISVFLQLQTPMALEVHAFQLMLLSLCIKALSAGKSQKQLSKNSTDIP